MVRLEPRRAHPVLPRLRTHLAARRLLQDPGRAWRRTARSVQERQHRVGLLPEAVAPGTRAAREGGRPADVRPLQGRCGMSALAVSSRTATLYEMADELGMLLDSLDLTAEGSPEGAERDRKSTRLN